MGPRAWCIDLEHLIDGLPRQNPAALPAFAATNGQLFPDTSFGGMIWQRLLASGDRDAAAPADGRKRCMLAVRVASFWRLVARLSAAGAASAKPCPSRILQQRFRVPPRNMKPA